MTSVRERWQPPNGIAETDGCEQRPDGQAVRTDAFGIHRLGDDRLYDVRHHRGPGPARAQAAWCMGDRGEPARRVADLAAPSARAFALRSDRARHLPGASSSLALRCARPPEWVRCQDLGPAD